MDSETGQSAPATVSRGQLGESGWGRFIVDHVAWPGWTFAVTVNRAGVLVGFEMYGDGRSAGSRKLADLRTQAGTLVPATDGPVLTARLLRKVPVRDLEDAARAWVIRARAAHASVDASRLLRDFHADGPPVPRRVVWDDAKLAKLAADYVTIIGGGDHTPIRTLSGREYKSQKRIRNLLSQARGEGLLTHPPAGRAGGQLTDKARGILDGQH